MEKIWLNSYEDGISGEIDCEKYASLCEVFRYSSERFRDKDAFCNLGTTLTYGEVAMLAEYFAAYLQNTCQVQKGDRVAVMLPNLLQYPVVIFGILLAGGVVVNVNPLYKPRELQYQLVDSGAKTIVLLENCAYKLQEILPQTQVKNIIISTVGDLLGSLKGLSVNFFLRNIKKSVENYHLPNAVKFTEILKKGGEMSLKRPIIDKNDLAFLQYTGGTTGKPKGAMLSHGNLCANMAQAGEWIKKQLEIGREVVFTPLPLYHIFSLTINLLIFFEIGAKNVLISDPRDIKNLIKTLKNHKVTVLTGVNTLFNALIHSPEFKSVDFSSWKLTVSGGAVTQRAVAEQWIEITHLPLIEVYGLTEASPGVCANPLNIKTYTGMIGLPIPNTDVKMCDPMGNEVAVGEVGELKVKGPQVMKGYWDNPQETAAVFDADGFLATGDIGVMNEWGFIQLIDRKKDMVNVSGFNVYPNEVEDVVVAMDGIREAACIGIADEKTGEALKLFAVKSDNSITEQDVTDHCRKELTAYKVPKVIEFRDDLPKSSVGKILRRELREESLLNE